MANQQIPANLAPPTAMSMDQNLLSTLDVVSRDVMRDLIREQYDDWADSFGTLMRVGDMREPYSSDLKEWFEEEPPVRVIRTGAQINAGVGGAVAFNITLDANDVFTDGDGTAHIFPIVGDTITFPTATVGSKMEAAVTATNAAGPTITVLMKNPAWVLPQLASGTTIIQTGWGGAEGSSNPASRVQNYTKFSANAQIIKAYFESTDVAMATDVWFDVDDGGNTIRFLYKRGQDKADYQLRRQWENVCLFGDAGTAGAITDPLGTTNRSVVYTDGLDTVVEARGTVDTFPIGQFSVTTFNEMAAVAEEQRAGNQQLILAGFSPLQQIEDALVDYTKDTAVNYTYKGNWDRMVDVGFQGIKKGGAHFLFKKMGILSNPQQWAAAGYEDYNNLIYVLPMGEVKYNEVNPGNQVGGSNSGFTFGYFYRALHDQNLEIIHKLVDGTGQVPGVKATKMTATQEYECSMHRGFIMRRGNVAQKWTGA